MDRGQVADGEFVESCCHSAVLLELVDAALDGVAVAVDLGVERWWPPATRAAVAAFGELIDRDRFPVAAAALATQLGMSPALG